MQQIQNFEQERKISQYKQIQSAELIMLLQIEVQCYRSYIDSLNKNSYNDEQQISEQLLKSLNDQKILKNKIEAQKENLYQKDQLIYNLKQQKNEIQENFQNLNNQLENYIEQFTNNNKQNASVCLLNQEIIRLRENINKSKLETSLKLQIKNNKIQSLQNENQNQRQEYINLTKIYQDLRIEFENLQNTQQYYIYLQANQTNQYQIGQKTQQDILQNQNKFSTQTFSQESNKKKPFQFLETQTQNYMSQQMSQLIRQNFDLKVQLQKQKQQDISNDKRDSFHNLNQTPKSNRTHSHENLSIGYKNTANIATKLDFNIVNTKTNENFESINLKQYFEQKQDLYNSLNQQEIEISQKKLYQIKKLNESIRTYVQKNPQTLNDNKKLLGILKEGQKNFNFEQNLDLQIISQNKQQNLQYIKAQNEILKQLNLITNNQIQFQKNKQLQLNQKTLEFQNLKERSESSIIKKPDNEQLKKQQEFIQRLEKDFEKEYKQYIDLDRMKDQLMQNSQIEEFQLIKLFKNLDEQIIKENEYVGNIHKNLNEQKIENNNTYSIFSEWIQNENIYKEVQNEIENQQLVLSQHESELLEKNQKHLFQVSDNNLQQIDNSKQKLSKSFDPQQLSGVEKSKFKLNQTIGNEVDTKFPSIKLSDYDYSENFMKFEKQTPEKQQNVLNLQDSLFRIFGNKKKDENYTNSGVKEKDEIYYQNLQNRNTDIQQSPQQQKIKKKKSLSDQQIQNQQLSPQFSQTKLEVNKNDLDSNVIESSRTEKTNPYKRYHTFQEQQDQQKNLDQFENLPSKGSAKSDFSRIFSHIGKIGSKQTADLKFQYDKQSQKVLINDQDFVQLQEGLTNLEKLNEKYEQILQNIVIITSAQNLEIDKLPDLISNIKNENDKYKRDFIKSENKIDQLQKQVEDLIEQRQEFQDLNRKLNSKIQQFQNNFQKSNQFFNKSNPFENTKNFESFNGFQNPNTLQVQKNNQDNITQEIPQQDIMQSNVHNLNNSKLQYLQIEQLVQQNDFLMQRLQEERQKKTYTDSSQKIVSLENLLQKCEIQLKQFRNSNTSIREEIQQKEEKLSKIVEESKIQQNTLNQKILFLKQQNDILTKDYQIIEKEKQEYKKRGQNQYKLDYELEKEKNERLLTKIKNLQKIISNQPKTNYEQNQYDYYIDLIDKLKEQNKQLNKRIHLLEKYEDQCNFLKRQLQMYEKDQLPDKESSKQ